MNTLQHGDITGEIIGAACEVWKVLGYGFLERVYENALAEELGLRRLAFHRQVAIDVTYKGIMVGQYIADLLVEDTVLIELKAEKELNPKHQAQLLNYLKATGIRVGMILNFGEHKCDWKRMVV